MTRGQNVRIAPHGKPEQAAVGLLGLISDNERAVLVAFDEKPPFVTLHEGFAVHPTLGIVMLLHREAIGPWVEVFGGGHYEIEEVAP
jgi:hypothetical protein